MKALILAAALISGIDYDSGLSPGSVVAYDVFGRAPDARPANPIAVVYVGDGIASDIQREEYEDLAIDYRTSGHPDWVKSIPTTHFKQGGRWWAVTGVATKVRLLGLLKPTKPATAPVSPSGYRIRFSTRRWTFPGDIRTHLMGGMHGFTAAELNGYSTQQLIQIHNWEHENGRPRLSHGSRSTTRRTTRRTTRF